MALVARSKVEITQTRASEPLHFDSDAIVAGADPQVRDRALDFHWRVPKEAATKTGWRASGNLQYDRAVRSVMAALVLAHRASEGWVSYSRRRKWYVGRGRYRSLPYTYNRIIRIVKEFHALGLIDEERAQPGDNKRTGLQSRLRATAKLIQAFEGVHFAYDPIETVRLKAVDGQLLDYVETDQFAAADVRSKASTRRFLTLGLPCLANASPTETITWRFADQSFA